MDGKLAPSIRAKQIYRSLGHDYYLRHKFEIGTYFRRIIFEKDKIETQHGRGREGRTQALSQSARHLFHLSP